MRIIQRLCEMIEEEINDAEKYIDCAEKVSDTYPKLAETFYKLSLSEMDHMKSLHTEVTDIIADYRKTNGEPPEGMLAVYNYLHQKFIDHAAEVKTKQTMYKEG